MLLQRRQDIPPLHHLSTSYLDSLSFTNSSTPAATSISPSLDFSVYRPQLPRSAYVDTRSTDFDPLSLSPAAVPSMSGFEYANPAIRIQQSTPTPQASFASSGSESLATAPFVATAAAMGPQGWDQYTFRKNMAHRRGLSSSSAASNPASPYHRSQFSSVKAEQSPIGAYLSADGRRGFSNLPTPTDTPTSDSFTPNGLSATNNQPFDTSAMPVHYAMKDMLMGGQEVVPDTPDFSHSARLSVSSYNEHEAPTTPRTVSGDELDYRTVNQDTMKAQPVMAPKFDRSFSDMLQDELFNPIPATSMPYAPRNPSNASLLSPYSASRNLQERLQAANKARSTSPSSRDASPYRQSSAYADYGNRYDVARQMKGQLKPDVEASALRSNVAKQSQAEPTKSVSPKDTIIEYRETEADTKMPLFPEEEANEYETRYGGGEQHPGANATSGNYNPQPSAQSYNDMASDNSGSWAVPQHSSTSYPHSSTMNLQAQTTYAPFAQQPIQMSTDMHGLPFGAQSYRTVGSMSVHEDTPDFPAHLTSMESSMSEAAPTSSQNSIGQQDAPLQKPGSSLADTGTYSCTYHGCSLRFVTPQKLQKHKREAHRSVGAATTLGVGSGMTSAQLLARNSQAGPHRCDRINPTTGKSCNTIFSRPYDLTRHEDTIHNIRKQKVRCALCVEEKTFSRNDALTRHMRVVHPEVDFPGKHRRRGAGSD